jgi:hypothetical protein
MRTTDGGDLIHISFISIIYTYTDQVTTQLLRQHGRTYSKSDDNSTSTSSSSAQITHIISMLQRECCTNKSKTKDTKANIF